MYCGNLVDKKLLIITHLILRSCLGSPGNLPVTGFLNRPVLDLKESGFELRVQSTSNSHLLAFLHYYFVKKTHVTLSTTNLSLSLMFMY